MRNFIASLVGNSVLANVVMIIIIVVGVIAAATMTRESMPEFEIRIILVEVPFPGADPEEVEEGISSRIEAVIDGLEGVKEYHTESWEGFAVAQIEVADGYDVQEVKDRVENAVNSIATFPVRAERPLVYEVRDDDEVLDLALWGDLPERQLKEWAETVRADLQRLPGISRVEVWDTRNYEISIEVSKERLWEYGLTLDDVSQAVLRGSLNVPSGEIKSQGEKIRIRTIGRKYTGREFESIVVKASPNGDIITLDRVATVRDAFTEDPSYATFNGHPAVMIGIMEAPGEDVLANSDAVRAYAAEKQKSLPQGLYITPCFDSAEFVRAQIELLSRNGLQGMLLVIGVLWLFLNTRLSFWIAMGIPVSLCGALGILWALGHSINQISLIAFIVVLGIVVDDAIVIGEAIYLHRQRGQPPLQAAIEGVCEVGVPVLAAVTTTMVAFLPLAFVPGILGQIIATMPLVVISTLAISTVESLFLLPAHLNHLPNVSQDQVDTRGLWGWFRRFHAWFGTNLERFAGGPYARLIALAVRHRYATIAVALSCILITVGLVGGGIAQVVFWPPADGNHLRAMVEYPPGTPPEVTRAGVDQIRSAVERLAARTPTTSGEPLIKNIYTRVMPNSPNMGRVIVEMPNPSQRGVHSSILAAEWEKETGAIPGAIQLSFFEDRIGMGGPQIEIWLQGKDLRALQAAAVELKDKLRTYDGVYQIADDFRAGRTELQVRLKPEAHVLGLTLDQVARQLYTGYYGEEAIRLQRGRDDMRVRIRYPEAERQSIAELQRIRVKTPRGNDVPLLSVADVSLAPGYASIKGSNGLRRVAVTAAADVTRANPSEVIADLEKSYLDDLAARYGLSWSIEGVEESNMETMAGIQRGFLISLLGIFIILATTFRSYLQPFLIMLIIPFGMVGGVLGHLLFGIPLTFLSLFGFVALSGVVVNDSIVLFECVNNLMAEGMQFFEALVQGGIRRFRAIFLTSITTVFGLLPLVSSRDLAAQVVIPMGVAIAAGVGFAMIVTLVVSPCLLAIVNDARRAVYRLLRKRWPTPEEVEPASRRPQLAEEMAALTTANSI